MRGSPADSRKAATEATTAALAPGATATAAPPLAAAFLLLLFSFLGSSLAMAEAAARGCEEAAASATWRGTKSIGRLGFEAAGFILGGLEDGTVEWCGDGACCWGASTGAWSTECL